MYRQVPSSSFKYIQVHVPPSTKFLPSLMDYPNDWARRSHQFVIENRRGVPKAGAVVVLPLCHRTCLQGRGWGRRISMGFSVDTERSMAVGRPAGTLRSESRGAALW